MAAEPISLKLTSPIYGGGGERSETEGALAKVAPTVLGQTPNPLGGHPSTREGKATHCILSRLRLPTNAVRCAPVGQAKRRPTHNP